MVLVPVGWSCFWCAALKIMPDAALVKNGATVFVRGSSCVGTLNFTSDASTTGPDKEWRLLCVPGLKSTRTGAIHAFPKERESSLTINGLHVPTPIRNATGSCSILNITAVVNEGANQIR